MLLTGLVEGNAEVPVFSEAAIPANATESVPSGTKDDVAQVHRTEEPGTKDAHFDNILVQRDPITGILPLI